jgi:lysophospholipase L1-like esterase
VVLLAISLALNRYLFKLARRYYLQLNETRLDPVGLSYYSATPDPRLGSVGLVTVVLYGDSRAAQWPAPQANGFVFVNRGIGAETSAQARQRFDAHVVPLRPQVVLIQVGINDLKTIPLFPERRGAIVDGCVDNIRRIVDKSTDLGAVVILTTIFPVGVVPVERMPFWSDDVPVAVDEVNAALRSWEGDTVIVLDAFALLADEQGVARSAYSEDLLHLTRAGYEVLNDALVPVLTTAKEMIEQ